MQTKPRMKAENRVELVHVSLMRKPEFALFAGLFMVGRTTVVDGLPTARTNGRDAQYGREFVDSLSDRELAFLIMHENMHKAYRHLTTWRALFDENPRLANIACDFVINLQLTDLDPGEQTIAFPRDKATGKRIGLYDERFRGMDTKQVFDILKDECKGDDGSGGESGDGEGTPADGKGRQGVDNSDGGHGGFDEHDWDGAQEMDKEEAEQLERDIDHALRQGAIYAGRVGGNVPRGISELLAPKVDWREVLRQFIKTSLRDRDAPSWRKAHKRYLWQDVILPAITGKRVKSLAIAIDTSGSIQGAILDAFMSEVDKIVKDTAPERIDVIYWDSRVAGHEVYHGSAVKELVQTTKPRGGGGTDPDVIPPFMAEQKIRPDALVVLSDGYMDSSPAAWAGVRAPVLWCLIGSKTFKIPCGKCVFVIGD
jgi:predicted metal-dependent peptidase